MTAPLTYADALAACVGRWGAPSWADHSALPRAAWSWGRGASRTMVIGDAGRVIVDVTDDDADSIGEPWQRWHAATADELAAAIAAAHEYMATHGGASGCGGGAG